MINIETVDVLKKKGFEMSAIKAALNTAEATGEANLDGWVIRYNDNGKMIVLHPSWCGIYMGDFNSYIIFQKNLSYKYSKYGFMHAKHSDLSNVLSTLAEHKTNGCVLCECDASSFDRRRKQVEKLGYSVIKSNISTCESSWSTCYFLIE